MSQVINTNMASLSAQRALGNSQGDVTTSLQRLSSGLRINSAKDDAAGLAISERFNSQIKGLNQAVRNANDAVSLSQTAESALAETTGLLQRARELSVQAANATNSSSDRTALQSEVTQIIQEIDRIADTTEFNGIKLLNGNFTSQQFQVGANSNQTVGVTLTSAAASSLGSATTVTFTDFEAALASAPAATPGSARIAEVLTFSVTENGASVATTVSVAADAQSNEVADSINASVAGLTAKATTGVTLDDFNEFDSGETYTLAINGVSIGAITSTNAVADGATVAAAIQAQSALAGLTVSESGGKVTITDTSGKDITVDVIAGTADSDSIDVVALDASGAEIAGTAQTIGNAASAADGVVISGAISFTTDKPNASFTVSSSVGSTSNAIMAASAAADTAENGATGTSSDRVSSINIGTVLGAQSAIQVLDTAIATVSTSRANLGAIQNRFDSVVSSLQASAENQSGARSRIVDADFAAETAALTRGQILQQAGIAVLAQANAAPQNVLALLQ